MVFKPSSTATRTGTPIPPPPTCPRDDLWWKQGEDLYRTGFQQPGFHLITQAEAQPGDGFFGKVRSDVPNHGGILLEKGLALHHLNNRLSRREPLGPWLKYVTHWVRWAQEV